MSGNAAERLPASLIDDMTNVSLQWPNLYRAQLKEQLHAVRSRVGPHQASINNAAAAIVAAASPSGKELYQGITSWRQTMRQSGQFPLSYTLTMRWPTPVVSKIDTVVKPRFEAAGGGAISRSELTAYLVGTVLDSGHDLLVQTIRWYRFAPIAEVLRGMPKTAP